MNESNILFQIKSLEQLILRELFMKDMFFKKIPSPTQMRIIDYIIRSDDECVYQKDLESVFNLRRATISGVLITMEKNNMIVRNVSKNDTRVKEIRLSPKTKKIFDENKKRLLELEHVILEGISEEEISNFSNVINKMVENIHRIK